MTWDVQCVYICLYSISYNKTRQGCGWRSKGKGDTHHPQRGSPNGGDTNELNLRAKRTNARPKHHKAEIHKSGIGVWEVGEERQLSKCNMFPTPAYRQGEVAGAAGSPMWRSRGRPPLQGSYLLDPTRIPLDPTRILLGSY